MLVINSTVSIIFHNFTEADRVLTSPRTISTYCHVYSKFDQEVRAFTDLSVD